MKIIFMGTSEFSCPTLLELIADKDFEVVAVYTREPKVAGRGNKLQKSPIHELALTHNLKIITPKTLRDTQTQQEFLELKADAAVVVSYGLILPKEILSGTKLGCINIHPSLLPKWRGAAPIQRTIMSGDQETAIDIIKMDEGVDSGDVIFEEKFALNGKETYANLSTKLAKRGAEILVKTLKDLRDNKEVATPQNHEAATYAKKIEKNECQIDWQNSAQEIEQKIRALSGFLEAYFIYDDEKIKIFAAEILDKNSCENEAGKILDEKFSIQCKSGIIRPLILQRQGKKPMPIKEILLGFKPKVGKILSSAS